MIQMHIIVTNQSAMAGGIFIPILQLRRRNGKEEAGIMITVVFDEKNEYARAAGLWQWDYGQVLRIQGLTLPTAVEIHFSLAETGGRNLPCRSDQRRCD